MTEIKTNDIVKITSSDEELNGTFLVSSIHKEEIVLKSPPDKEYTLPILEGVIEQVNSIVVIHSAKLSGYAERMGYLMDKRVCVTFTDGIEECGIISKVEFDTVDIQLDNGTMIYIDFEYEGIPEGILSIRLDELLQIDEIEEYYIFPENKHRYPLASQLIDLMDSLIKSESSTSKNIKYANLVVKRFKELKTLFSNENGDPRILPSNYKPTILPHQVKWIVPSIHVHCPLYTGISSATFYKEIETLQNGRGSYTSIYKQILEQWTPIYSDLNGLPVTQTVQAVLPSSKFIESKCGYDYDHDIFLRKWNTQVLTSPYQSVFSTTPERVAIDGYYTLQDAYKTYTTLQLPQTKLLNKLSERVARPVYSTFYKHLQNCVPELSDMLSNLDPFLSIYAGLQQTEPYLVYSNDVNVQYTPLLTQQLEEHIQTYKQRAIPDAYLYTPPSSMVDPVYGSKDKSSSEWHLWANRQDYGRLYTLHLQTFFEIEYLQSLKDKLHLSEPKGISPPVVKQYASLDSVRKDKGKTIFWDKDLDTTNYEEMKSYPTELLLLQYLVDIKEMSMPLARQYAPHFLNKKKVVVDGDYAKMNEVYFKRISNEWVLDETCSGPYPCASNEPCTTDCVDITFRFNENTKRAILNEYTELSYINEPTRISQLTKTIDEAKVMAERLAHLQRQKEYFYNNKMLPLRDSVSVMMGSVHQPLLFFILQKPHYERYKELAAFIAMYTRPPAQGERDTWLYCTTSNTALVPSVYTQLIEVYASPEKYEEFIKNALLREIIVRDDENYILKDSGYPVGPISFSQVFDDLVRSSELNEEALFDVPRLIHEDTPVIIQLLSEIGTIAKIAMTKYFNFIVREMEKQSKLYILYSIGYMFKIASIVYTFNISDGINAVLKHQEKLFRIMKNNGFTDEYTLSDKLIMSSIVTVSSKFAIQQLMYTRERKLGHRTAHTIWNTFLPPVEITRVKTEGVHPMNILLLFQQDVQSSAPLRPGNHRVNTCRCTFQGESIQKLVDQYPVRKPIRYTQDIPFIRNEFIPTYEGLPTFQAFKLIKTEPVVKEQEDFVERMTEVRTRLHRCITIPDKFFVPNISINYLKEFISFISVLCPEILQTGYMYTLEVSPVIMPILSKTHYELLLKLTSKHYFNELRSMFPDSSGLGLHSVSSSVEIKQILKQLETPMTESSIYELYYYIYRIFEIYLTNSDPDKSCVLIKKYIDIFMNEKSSIFLTYEEIRRKVVKIKTKESTDRRLKLLGLSPADKAIHQFREENNLDPEAKIGRLRTYHADAFESLYSIFHSKETEENGTDGNIYDAE